MGSTQTTKRGRIEMTVGVSRIQPGVNKAAPGDMVMSLPDSLLSEAASVDF